MPVFLEFLFLFLAFPQCSHLSAQQAGGQPQGNCQKEVSSPVFPTESQHWHQLACAESTRALFWLASCFILQNPQVITGQD